jgi:uncharacterized protein
MSAQDHDSEALVLTKTNEIQKNTPGILKVLGAFILDLFLLGVFWFFLMIIATAVWAVHEFMVNAGTMPNSEPGTLGLLLISMPSLYLAVLSLSAWRGRAQVLPQLPIRNGPLFFMAVGVGFLMFLLVTGILYFINSMGPALEPSNQKIIADLAKQWPIAVAFYAILVAPLFEELFFRKQIFARFAKSGYAPLGYLISSILFALSHEASPGNGVGVWLLLLAVYSAMGAVFAYLYQRTGRLWPAMVAHATNNVFAVSALFIQS